MVVQNMAPMERLEKTIEVYRFLADCYLHEPTFRLMTSARVDYLEYLVDVFETQEIKEHITKVLGEWRSIPKLRRQIREDYRRLFQPLIKSYLIPYESYYRNRNCTNIAEIRHLWEVTVQEVQNCYDAAGFESRRKEHPDHIGRELEFIGFLMTKEHECLKKGMNERARHFALLRCRFLAKHLDWLPELCRAMNKEAGTNFYKGLASWTEQLIRDDHERLREQYFFGRAEGECCNL